MNTLQSEDLRKITIFRNHQNPPKRILLASRHLAAPQRCKTTNNTLQRLKEPNFRLSITPIAGVVMQKMVNHIGFSRAISKDSLFAQLFRTEFRDNSIKDWVRWEFVKKALHHLRKYTHCFVVSECRNGQWFYFVPETGNDISFYTKMLDNTVKKIRWMQKRAEQAVTNQWYKEKWELKRLRY